MPATRKSTRGGAAAAKSTRGKQSTLSFNNRVSKAGAARASAKEAAALTPPPSSAAEGEKKKKVVIEPVNEGEEAEELEIVTQQPDEDEVEDAVQARPAAEVRAEKITDARITKYWREVENARIARRVHQEDLSLAEKVLRYFDISSQYGPCIGISRTKRWYRAERLGLSPPIEVLAVLLAEEKQGNGDIERSAMDRHLESTAIGSG